MKGNNSGGGITARQQLLFRRRLLVAFAYSSVCFFLGTRLSYQIMLPPNYEMEDSVVEINVRERVLEYDPLEEFMKDALTPDYDPALREQVRQILSASTNLIKLRLGTNPSANDHTYNGIIAEFCPINFAAQKKNPVDFSTFGDVVENSHCYSQDGREGNNIIRVDFQEVVRLAKKYDAYVAKNIDRADSNTIPTILDLKGVVFHEGRSGSVLAANSIMAADPTKNRIYNEPGPPEFAMQICQEGYSACSVETSANLVRDVVYMMGRSNDPKEHNLFFVLHPEATRTMESFRKAFPMTPWIFLYREPIDAIMSQGENHPAFSLDESPMVTAFVKRRKFDIKKATTIEKYAIQLATFCWSAIRNFKDADGLGMGVKYSYNLAEDFVDTILPVHFRTPVDYEGEKRIDTISTKYNNRKDGVRPGPPGDRRRRSRVDTPQSVSEAAKFFLDGAYKKLQDSKYNFEDCRFYRMGVAHLRCQDQDELQSED